MTSNGTHDRHHTRNNTPFPHSNLHNRAFLQLKRRNVTAPQLADLLRRQACPGSEIQNCQQLRAQHRSQAQSNRIQLILQ